jgi:two-component system, OmpR family, alkaline phosphatase synthesis response regulator PhoP
MAKILILESEDRLSDKVCKTLTHAGYECMMAETASDGLALVTNETDKVVTVIGTRTNWSDSYALLNFLQQRGWPVLFMTRNVSNAEHLKSLYHAGCAVLSTSAGGIELVACIAELLRHAETKLTVGSLQMDVKEHQATLDGKTLALTSQEFSLLQALMESPNATLTREQLLRTAWGYLCIGETRTVDVHIQRLRKKIGIDSIETIYKMGYRLAIV